MAFAILLVSGIAIYQKFRSESAIKALNRLTQQLVTVVRNGEVQKIPSEEIVYGDRMQIAEGDQVSADGEITEFNDFFIDESILTGESLPVEKKLGEVIYSGSTVTTGSAWVTIVAVGVQTKLGLMGKAMDETEKEKTPLQKQVDAFVKKMALFGIVAFAAVWIYNYIESGNALQGLMHGLTLAMAVLPEEIPVALATFMALGAYRMIKNNVLAKHPQTVEALGAATVICVDKTGTITENKMQVAGIFDFENNTLIVDNEALNSENSRELLLIAMLASEEDPFDPMEKAIHNKYKNVFPTEIHFNKTFEYPLSGSHPMMTHVYEPENGERIIACKGAPEGIIELSDLNTSQKEIIYSQLKSLALQGNRVLAVGKGIYDANTLPVSQHEFKFNFLGLIALSDPPRENMTEVIQKFYESGVEVKMITGDFPETAMSIASKINLRNSSHCITGKEIDAMTNEELKIAAASNTVFARVMPEVKLRIIDALKQNGEVVAMTGDGVNDGPALKAAHIGIAMGKRGSEVARKAASLVLLNDDLSNMVKAIAFGRSIYSNLKKAIRYIISIHIPLISVVTIPLLLGWKFPNIFSPIHVIFLELIMGPTCSIVYENEPIDSRLINLKPRKMTDSLFTWRELSTSMLQGFMIAVGILLLAFILMQNNNSETHIRTMVFVALVFSNILLTLTGRSTTDSIRKTIRYKNKLIPIMIAVTLILTVLTILVVPVLAIFEFEQLSFINFVTCLAVALLSVMWIELVKEIRLKNNKPQLPAN
jgi:P-type Ca2+ transporter type 2C